MYVYPDADMPYSILRGLFSKPAWIDKVGAVGNPACIKEKFSCNVIHKEDVSGFGTFVFA